MRLFTSPRERGEVGAKRRVRGPIRESERLERPPHPTFSLRSKVDLSPQAGRGKSGDSMRSSPIPIDDVVAAHAATCMRFALIRFTLSNSPALTSQRQTGCSQVEREQKHQNVLLFGLSTSLI
jgi:hypothetical protein